MFMLGSQSKTSSSAEVDFLNLCTISVRSIEDLVNGGNLLNQRQCQDLSTKLSKINLNIRELVLQCGASIRPALENLYRYVEKAKLLVQNCGEKEWWLAAVFQVQNENAFREILLDVGLCYNAVYEQAKSMSEDANILPDDLRQTSVFAPTMDSDIHELDLQEVQKRLEVLANEPCSVTVLDRFLSGKGDLKQYLAKYLLLKLKFTSEQSQVNTLHTGSAILWSKASEPSGTWGNYRFLGGGSGASGVCSTKWMGIPCAKKEFHLHEAERLFLKEAGILAHLKHPCIVNFFCCGNGSEKGDRFIAMELMEKSLANLIDEQKGEYFSIPVVVDMMVQMARGMYYLHEQGVAHRDLKPQNVVVSRLASPHLVDHFCLKLVDFEMSKTKVEVSKANTISVRGVGTTIYRAPEVHPKAHPDGKGKAMWHKADIYSFAMTCSHLLSLQTPYEGIHLSELYREIKKGQRPELPINCPQELVALLRECWNDNPNSRPSFMEICTRLETIRHKILRGFSILDQEERMDFSSSFDYIKSKVKEHSSIHIPLVDDIENDAKGEHENNKFDVVSIIPCTCGRTLQFLPQPPTKYEGCVCNICEEKIYGEVYHCETCDFDVHPDCANIKDKARVSFHEDHLHLLVQYYYKDNRDAVCGFCEESLQESEWVYRCDQCDFDVHALCTKYPKKVEHEFHIGHVLTLTQPSPRKNRCCTICNCDIKGYRYACTLKWCLFYVHPSCLILPWKPLCIFDSSHKLFLSGDSRGFHCGHCGTLGFSWFYHCDECDVDIHVDCVDDMEEEEDSWKEAYEKFMLEYGNKEDHAKTLDMISEVLNRLFLSSTLEASSSSSSRILPVMMRTQSTIHRPTLAEGPGLDAFDDANLRKQIAAETVERQAKKMAAREARQTLKAKSLEMLGNLERAVLDLQGSKNTSQADAEVLAAKLKKLKGRQDALQEEKAVQALSKMRQGPSIGVFYGRGASDEDCELLTSFGADTGYVYIVLLCEELGHEHISDGSLSWPLNGSYPIGERWEENLQAMLVSGLQVVTRALNTVVTELNSVALPEFGRFIFDLRAIDLEKHSKPSGYPFEAEENVEALKRAEDSSAKWLLRNFEAIGGNMFKLFGLQRVRYTVTEEANSPRYTEGALAWLCSDHLNRGVEAGTLESYPLRMYHNAEYDDHRQVDY